MKRERTVAKMTLTLPDGTSYPLWHDFGYDYDPYMAEYMFMDGNYACDCWLSICLNEEYGDSIPEFACGDTIQMESFQIVLIDDSGNETVVIFHEGEEEDGTYQKDC